MEHDRSELRTEATSPRPARPAARRASTPVTKLQRTAGNQAVATQLSAGPIPVQRAGEVIAGVSEDKFMQAMKSLFTGDMESLKSNEFFIKATGFQGGSGSSLAKVEESGGETPTPSPTASSLSSLRYMKLEDKKALLSSLKSGKDIEPTEEEKMDKEIALLKNKKELEKLRGEAGQPYTPSESEVMDDELKGLQQERKEQAAQYWANRKLRAAAEKSFATPESLAAVTAGLPGGAAYRAAAQKSLAARQQTTRTRSDATSGANPVKAPNQLQNYFNNKLEQIKMKASTGATISKQSLKNLSLIDKQTS